MKSKFIIGASLLLAQLSFSAPAEVMDIKSTFTFKTTDGKAFEVTEKDAKDKKIEIKIRPSKQINKVVFDDTYEIILTSDKSEVVFETKQSRGKIAQKPDKDGTAKPDVIRIKYIGEAEKNKQPYGIECYETLKSTDETAKAEEAKTIECLKKEGCKSYTVKDTASFESKETPICIGTKDAKIIKKQVQMKLNCGIYDKENKIMVLSQVLGEKEITEVKSSEKCK
jgi:hypothetical protein